MDDLLQTIESGGFRPPDIIQPSREGWAFVKQGYAAPGWATGCISGTDACFLFDMLKATQARRLVEFGVASGTSTAFILRVLAALGNGAELHSFDALDYYYGDSSIKLGQYVFDVHGPEPAALHLFPGTGSTEVGKRIAGTDSDPVDFAFIDANHSHPFPCFDLLALLPVMAPGSWVVLHDINLPFIYPDASFGPHYLFYNWPGEKRVFPDARQKANIGAIRLLDAVADNVEAVLRLLEIRWDSAYNVPPLAAFDTLLARLDPAQRDRLDFLVRQQTELSLGDKDGRLREEVARLESRLEAEREAANQSRLRLREIEASTSWRATAGLRAAGTALAALGIRRPR
jgi:predicted O-methyltransferase YrrM